MKERTKILDRERDGMKVHDVEALMAPAWVLGSILGGPVQLFEMSVSLSRLRISTATTHR
jgi:hypothetical protein